MCEKRIVYIKTVTERELRDNEVLVKSGAIIIIIISRVWT